MRLEDGERIPLTIADYDREGGTVTIIFQIVGGYDDGTESPWKRATACMISSARWASPTHTEGLKKVAVVGGGVGCAIALPVAKKLHEQGCGGACHRRLPQ